MSEWFNLILGLGATFGAMCLFCMFMSIVVVLHESKDNVHSSSPSKSFANILYDDYFEKDEED